MPSLDFTLIKSKDVFRKLHQTAPGVDLFDEAKMNDDKWFKNFDIRDIDFLKLSSYIKL